MYPINPAARFCTVGGNQRKGIHSPHPSGISLFSQVKMKMGKKYNIKMFTYTELKSSHKSSVWHVLQ